MTIIQGTAYNATSTVTGHTITVPAGVTAAMVMLAAFSSGGPSAYTATYSSSRPGVTFTQLDQRAATNEYVTVFKATGLQAGDTVTVTLSAANYLQLSHIYDDAYDYGTPAPGVRSASTANTTTGSVTPTVGQRVGIVAVERTTAAGTTVTGVTLSNGDTPTVTQDTFAESAGTNQPAVSVYVGHYDAATATARTATVIHSAASTNGYAAQLLMSPLSVAAASAVVLPALGTIASAISIDSAAAAATLPPFTSAGTAGLLLASASAATLPLLQAAGAATATTTGTCAATLPGVQAAATAVSSTTAAATATLSAMVVAGAGTLTTAGVSSAALPLPTSHSTATLTEPEPERTYATSSSTVPLLSTVAAGTLLAAGLGAVTLPTLSSAAQADLILEAAANAALPQLGLQTTATVTDTADVTAVLPVLLVAGTLVAAEGHDITVTATLAPRRWAGSLPDRRWTGALR